MVQKLHSNPEYKCRFPQLGPFNHWVRSPKDNKYNCVAFALGEDERPWWPSSQAGFYWPEGVPEEETLDAFIAAFATEGYVPCDGGAPESGYEKIVLYALAGNNPKHAAKQLPNGKWISKLGLEEDIEHTLPALDGPGYGTPVRFFKRPVRPAQT